MSSFPGGSPWAMVRDIAAGYYLVTERSFRNLRPPDLDRVTHELDRQLRDIRGDQPPLEDLKAIQLRNRKIQRLRSAMMILRTYRLKAKR